MRLHPPPTTGFVRTSRPAPRKGPTTKPQPCDANRRCSRVTTGDVTPPTCHHHKTEPTPTTCLPHRWLATRSLSPEERPRLDAERLRDHEQSTQVKVSQPHLEPIQGRPTDARTQCQVTLRDPSSLAQNTNPLPHVTKKRTMVLRTHRRPLLISTHVQIPVRQALARRPL